MITSEQRDLWMVGLAAVVTALVAAFYTFSDVASAQERETDPERGIVSAERLFQRDCAICHGPRGEGTVRAPDISDAGTAAVALMVRTGRMPPPDVALDGYRVVGPLDRTEPSYTEDQIEALVEHTAAFIDGPEVPDVNVVEALEPEGGELFRLNCASCHQFAGNGGILIEDEAPTIQNNTPLEVAAAIRAGPGTMPAFPEDVLSAEELNAVTSYVVELQNTPDIGGISLLRFGPFTEGAIAWLVGIGALLATAKWIGRRT